MGIGERIRAEREREKISRAALAKAAGIAVSTLSDLENGRSYGTTALHRIAKFLGVRAEYLETGIGPKLTDSAHPAPSENFSPPEVTSGSHLEGFPEPILHEALTLLLYDLDHGGSRSANSAIELFLQLCRRLVECGGRLPRAEAEAFEAQARARGTERGIPQHAAPQQQQPEKRRKRDRH